MKFRIPGTLALLALVCTLPAQAQNAANKKKAPKANPRKPAQVGPAVNENKATPVNRISAAEGFNVELLYSVPGVEQGSWVNLCTDNKDRIMSAINTVASTVLKLRLPAYLSTRPQ